MHECSYETTITEEQRGEPRPGDGALAYYEVMIGRCQCGASWTQDTGRVSIR